ncbi:hypothetical protein CC1G_03737 [Coprinopsis cinerea okayama7|uniref:SprT-like domain-containing protein n=1 Tax=Coprinopsis cinerea (strain Okayama-7 / 130 / ATCC MYA-4618 / FGSC 9003) TaxID=240176 RepID=A8N244_COPC7|nr:hypothetical protein CC1G_03737 [Coprinopsis cinerea okayama7\|eukprot:XP_001828943.2 hypothetical protein CC1G_03737 [Coprinopsis cinerea okayama7\
MLMHQPSWKVEVIPDSEDERQRVSGSKIRARQEVIEISSESEDEKEEQDSDAESTFPGAWRQSNKPGGKRSNLAPKASGQIARGTYMRSRVIESSDSETSDQEEGLPKGHTLTLTKKTWSARESTVKTPSSRETTTTTTTLFSSKQTTTSRVVEAKSEDADDDDAILVFDEPKSARKPIPKRTLLGSDSSNGSFSVPSTPGRIFGRPEIINATPGPPDPRRTSPRKRGAGTPRVSKKKTREEEQAKLREYASELFQELNRTVFNNELPFDTKLNWNKRLLTTAGRAKWHRSREGVQTSEIELAEKILTSSERIRNTLSHEMCHLASWVIDKEIKEGHGRFWKAWTRKVMAMYPNINISTRHDYEIEYPYNWKCAKCAKIYGRFSKSIKPDECVCGACREGRLIPQFETRTPKPNTPRISRMAAAKGQDSPCASPIRPTPPNNAKRPEVIYICSDSEDDSVPLSGKATCCGIDSLGTDSEDDIEVLAMTLKSTSLAEAD